MQTITMPKRGQAMEEGTVVEWAVDEGDAVSENEEVLVFETEKVTDEILADEDGVLLRKEVAEGETVEVGTVLGYVGDPDEEPPASVGESEAVEEAAEAPESIETEVRGSPSARRAAREAGVAVEAVGRELGVSQVRESHIEEYQHQEHEREILASPYAEKIAGERGVEIQRVGETFGTDRVRAADVEEYVEREREPVAAVEPATAGEGIVEDAGGPAVSDTVPIEGARAAMYDRMSTVSAEYGSTTTVARVDVTDLVELGEQLGPAWEDEYGTRPSYTAFVVAAAGRALPDYPILNAEIVDGEEVRLYGDVNVGIAVNTDDALLVPVLDGADGRTVSDLSEEIGEMATAARKGNLEYDDLQGGTFTVSNAGNMGAYINTPQINPPQTAILGMCTIFDDAGVVDGEVVPRKYMHLCLTYDHRVVEGATAVGFLQAVKDRLEAPGTLLS